jgi:probable F420-dependent oxidoreductase
MSGNRPFRFGVLVSPKGAWQELAEKAKRVEGLGYDTLLVPDHVGKGELAATPALAAAATSTTTLRLALHVRNNDFTHPITLAREVASIDQLSNGRAEIGLGAGWNQAEYGQLGIRFDSPAVRIERLAESAQIMATHFSGQTVSFAGRHYSIDAAPAEPRAVQKPRPPIMIGGGGRRILTVAAQHSDIVGLHIRSLPDGPDFSTATEGGVVERVGWVRDAAGERFEELELQVGLFGVGVGPKAKQAIADMAARTGQSESEVARSPYGLFGSIDEICERLVERRERFGVSYIAIPDLWMDDLAPVVARVGASSV